MDLSEPAASIAKIGFRKWYERQLIDGHLALVTCILTGFLAALSLEAFTQPASVPVLAGWLLMAALASGAAWLAWRRYHRIMCSAWQFGEKSVCARCSVYGRLFVEGSGTHIDGAPWLDVQCKKCGLKWRMPE